MNRVFLLFSEDSRSLSRQKRAKSTIGGALTGIEIGKRHFSKTRTQSTFLCAEIGIETKNQLFSLESYLASSMKKGKYQKTFLFQVLRGWWPWRSILTVVRYSTEISVVENLGVLILGTDTSKSYWARVNLTFSNFLGNFTRHQVVPAWFNFHQCA